jgi:hypothetical protein
MNSARKLLLDRATRYLMDVGYSVEQPLTEPTGSISDPKDTLALGRAQFSAINAVLKASIDAADLGTFRDVDAAWSDMFEDVWLVDTKDAAGEELELGSSERARLGVVRELMRYREDLRLGLAMWAAHRLEQSGDEEHQQVAADVLRRVAAAFGTMEKLFEVFERTTEDDDPVGAGWSTWFLQELPERRAHMIPTSQKLLVATVLLAAILVVGEPTRPLRPRDWLDWRADEIDALLERLDEQAGKWGALLSPVASADPSVTVAPTTPAQEWRLRLHRLREVFVAGREQTRAAAKETLRRSPLDPERVAEFRAETLKQTREGRILRDTFELHGGLETKSAEPSDLQPRASRSWIPKQMFTPDSRVVGIDRAARDLARMVARAEVHDLLAALSAGKPYEFDGDMRTVVDSAIEDLRSAGWRPSLVVLPVGWELARAVGLSALAPLAPPAPHPLIPPLHLRQFEGVVGDVPAISLPEVEPEELWVVDLGAAAHYLEWPSDDGSGIRFELQEFDEAAATRFLDEHPGVRAEGRTPEEALLDIQERVLLSLWPCWTIRRGEPAAARRLLVPESLQRN